MRKLMLGMGAALLLAVPAALQAQDVDVSVTIASTASGALASDLNFGSVAPGSAATTIPLGFTNTGTQTIGAITITHSGNFSMNASTNTPSLTGAGDPIGATLSCQLYDATNGGTAIAGTAASDCTAIADWTGAGSTTMYLQIGGTLDAIPAAQTAGGYSATVTFTIAPL